MLADTEETGINVPLSRRVEVLSVRHSILLCCRVRVVEDIFIFR